MPDPQSHDLFTEGYHRALDLLRACSTAHGFYASVTDRDNYHRVWARDGAIQSLAALQSGDPDLVATARATLTTLADNQGPHGEIPSNVDPASGRVSYGGTTGRVDSDLWFVIACGEYWRATGDDAFIERFRRILERVQFLLGAWEFNNRGLLYVPQTGDWADEYLHAGYVLYDQVLYLQAQRVFAAVDRRLGDGPNPDLARRLERLQQLIRCNYWFDHDEHGEGIYHEVLYRKGRAAAPQRTGRYWMPFFLATGYGYRFDAFANVLVSLVGLADDEQRGCVDGFIEEIVPASLPLPPAFHPVIKPLDEDWKRLQMNFSYTFKNEPYEFHNGGLWPLIGGFYVADLAGRGRTEAARRHLEALHRANALPMNGHEWGFPEFVHGRDLTPGGTPLQGWNAAAAVLGHHALEGEPVFRIDGNDG